MTHAAFAALVAHPDGPAFTVVLVLHVGAALVGLVAVVASGVEGARVLAARGEPPAAVRAYFAPGVNWAGRVLYAVPLLGAALLGMSGGAYQVGDGWVLAGIGLWVAAAGVAEGLVWPAERRVQASLAAHGDRVAPPTTRRHALVLCASASLVVAIVVAAMVVMVAKP